MVIVTFLIIDQQAQPLAPHKKAHSWEFGPVNIIRPGWMGDENRVARSKPKRNLSNILDVQKRVLIGRKYKPINKSEQPASSVNPAGRSNQYFLVVPLKMPGGGGGGLRSHVALYVVAAL